MFYRDAKFWRRLQCLKHCVIDALALGRFWSFGLKGGGGGGDWKILGIKGGSQMVVHKKMQGGMYILN